MRNWTASGTPAVPLVAVLSASPPADGEAALDAKGDVEAVLRLSGAAGERVGMWAPLAGEVGQEQQSVRAGRDLGSSAYQRPELLARGEHGLLADDSRPLDPLGVAIAVGDDPPPAL